MARRVCVCTLNNGNNNTCKCNRKPESAAGILCHREKRSAGVGFRLFNLAGLIWPLSMDRRLSSLVLGLSLSLCFSLSLSLYCPLIFFRLLAKMRAGNRGLDLCRNRRRLLSVSFSLSLSLSCFSNPLLFLPSAHSVVLLNVCMREIGNADKRPCKFNPSVCPPFGSLADKEGTSVSTIHPSVTIPLSYLPSGPRLVDGYSGEGSRRRKPHGGYGMFREILGGIVLHLHQSRLNRSIFDSVRMGVSHLLIFILPTFISRLTRALARSVCLRRFLQFATNWTFY